MDRKNYGKQTPLQRLQARFDWNLSGKLIVFSVLAGLLSGLLASLAYNVYLHLGEAVFGLFSAAGIRFPSPLDYTDHSGPLPGFCFVDAPRQDVIGGFVLPRYWILIPLIPAFGGLLCGVLTCLFAPEATSEGTDSVIRAFHCRNGFLRKRLPLIKTLAGFLTLGTGGSAGWEGPTTLLGAGMGNFLSRAFHLGAKDRRILLLAGAAGGIGAIFQIPLGGAFYATEVLYASAALELTAFLPCALASMVGFSVFRFFHGDMRPFEIPSTVGIQHWSDPLVFLVFVPIIALAGILFVRMLQETRNRFFHRLPISDVFKPALGGFLLGCIALCFPQVLGGGYQWMHRLMEGQMPFLVILMLIIPKMLATSLTISSGGSGGLLAPSLLIGGLLGGVLGHLSGAVFVTLGCPQMAPDVVTCILVGMATFYAGIGKLPLAAAVIVCEMTGGHYTLLVPLVLLNLLHLALQSPSISLYEEQVLSPIDREAHFGNYSVDLLRSLAVKDILEGRLGSTAEMIVIPADSSIPDAVKRIASNPDSLFPVLDAGERYIGVVQTSDLWTIFRNRRKWGQYRAGDLVQNIEIAVRPGDDLYKALRICRLRDVSELPVVSPDDPEKLLGMLRHQEILAAYNERLAVARWS